MIACCGLDCSKCEGYIATVEDDDTKRAEVAKKWSELFKKEIKPEHINCLGCTADGVKLYYCEHMCEIRKCCVSRDLENCAACDDYICETLAGFIKMAPEAAKALERLRG